jgi:hypothetical protein
VSSHPRFTHKKKFVLFYQNLYQSLKLKALFGMVECDGVE